MEERDRIKDFHEKTYPVGSNAPENTILDEAKRLVYGARNEAYGHPLDDYTTTGRLWAGVLEKWMWQEGVLPRERRLPDLPAELACIMMTLVKVSRELNRPARDNRVDGAGYWACVDKVAEERARREKG